MDEVTCNCGQTFIPYVTGHTFLCYRCHSATIGIAEEESPYNPNRLNQRDFPDKNLSTSLYPSIGTHEFHHPKSLLTKEG